MLPPRRRRLAEWAESSFQVQHGKRESFAAGGGAEARPAGAVSTSGNGGHPHGVATYGPGTGRTVTAHGVQPKTNAR